VYGGTSAIEGRYGAALFIKPSVMAMNIKLWAKIDQQQQQALRERAAEAARRRQAGICSESSNMIEDDGDDTEEGEADGGDWEDSPFEGNGEDMWAGFWPEENPHHSTAT
jgi:hypothetical protein